MILKDKTVLVTGGSGSLGRYLIKELLKYPVKKIISLSRDEGLIKEAEQGITSNRVSFWLGDICDAERVEEVMNGIDFVFQAAALKHVSLAERFPREILKVNLLGLTNILENSEKVERFVYISSDKAIGCINCYGASKLLAEYLVRETNKYNKGKFFSVRCPNFFGSRGSVIDLWRAQISKNNTLSVTDPDMTRYFISLPDAARFLIKISLRKNIDISKVYYPQAGVRKFRLDDLARAFIEVFGNSKTKIKTVGSFPGEKLYENYLGKRKLLSINELKKALMALPRL